LQKRIAAARDQESQGVWKKQADDLAAWMESDEYKSGNFPQSVDQLMLELVEWRAMISAFDGVETEKSPFKEHIFFSQWFVGAAYAVFSIFGKLARGDNSLKTVWDQVVTFIAQDGACPADEIAEIKKRLHDKDGQFTNKNSQSLIFRNKVISHNEKSMGFIWAEIDDEIRVLIRIWSLLVSWSSFGIIEPFRTGEQAFSGLEVFFGPAEIAALKAKRTAYIERAKTWCRMCLHNDEIDPGRTAFATITVTSQVMLRHDRS
jgi:hypothetical protein